MVGFTASEFDELGFVQLNELVAEEVDNRLVKVATFIAFPSSIE